MGKNIVETRLVFKCITNSSAKKTTPPISNPWSRAVEMPLATLSIKDRLLSLENSAASTNMKCQEKYFKMPFATPRLQDRLQSFERTEAPTNVRREAYVMPAHDVLSVKDRLRAIERSLDSPYAAVSRQSVTYSMSPAVRELWSSKDRLHALEAERLDGGDVTGGPGELIKQLK